MDDDIRENLKELSSHVQDIGRQIGSTKTDIFVLMEMRNALQLDARTLDHYIEIFRMRSEK